jgi:hypothetical protein
VSQATKKEIAKFTFSFLSFVLHNQYLFQRNIRTNLGSTKVSNTSFTPTDNLLKTWVISIHSFSLFLLHIHRTQHPFLITQPPLLRCRLNTPIVSIANRFRSSLVFFFILFLLHTSIATQRPAYIIKQPPLLRCRLNTPIVSIANRFRFPLFSINLSKKIDTTKDYYKKINEQIDEQQYTTLIISSRKYRKVCCVVYHDDDDEGSTTTKVQRRRLVVTFVFPTNSWLLSQPIPFFSFNSYFPFSSNKKEEATTTTRDRIVTNGI